MSDPTDDPTELAATAAAAVLSRFSLDHVDLAVVLGSGWSAAADQLGDPIGACRMVDLPGFAHPVVAGHGGELRVVRTAAGKIALVFTGRTHYYEGRGTAAVAHGVRTAAASGAKLILLTNGCGGLRAEWVPGTPVLIADHINLTGATPLRGATFIDLTDAYSARLRALARSVVPDLDEGVYVQFPGPQYETPAEVRMAKVLGGDLVGMSTTLETIAAREAGLEVLGLSLVTNAAAGISSTPLDHAEVIQAGKEAAPRLTKVLTAIIGAL